MTDQPTQPPPEQNPWEAPQPGAPPPADTGYGTGYGASDGTGYGYAAPPAYGAPSGVAVPAGLHLSSPGRRLGAYLLDVVLFIVTLVIGYLIWEIGFAWRHGQTPGKQVLKMRVINSADGRTATWGRMALRDLLIKGIVFGIIWILFVVGAAFVFSDTRQALWDRIVGTAVVDDPQGVLAPA